VEAFPWSGLRIGGLNLIFAAQKTMAPALNIRRAGAAAEEFQLRRVIRDHRRRHAKLPREGSVSCLHSRPSGSFFLFRFFKIGGAERSLLSEFHEIKDTKTQREQASSAVVQT